MSEKCLASANYIIYFTPTITLHINDAPAQTLRRIRIVYLHSCEHGTQVPPSQLALFSSQSTSETISAP